MLFNLQQKEAVIISRSDNNRDYETRTALYVHHTFPLYVSVNVTPGFTFKS